MVGIGGLRPLEMGQSAAKVATDDIKKNFQTAQTQITGKPVKMGQAPAPQQPQAPDTQGDFGKILEQNQSQQTPVAKPVADPVAAQKAIEEKFAPQKKLDEAELAAARKNLQQIEEEMKKYRDLRKQKEEQEEQQEEQKEEQEELWKKEQQKQEPINAAQRSGEGGKKKG